MLGGLTGRFEGLWRPGEPPPDVFAFLEAHPDAAGVERLAIVLIDQGRRWRVDRPLAVEDYLARLPDLLAVPEGQLRLALGEFLARRDRGEPARVEDFLARFAGLGQPLRDALVGAAGGEAVDLRPTRDGDATEVDRRGEDPTASRPFDGTTDGPVEGPTESIRTASPDDPTVPDGEGGPPRARVPDAIGRYRSIRLLGEGTFGRVCLGFDPDLKRYVAIKIPAPGRFRGPADAEAFLAEARAVAALDHPNIVRVLDVGRMADGRVFVVSKFIEGPTLRDLIREGRRDHARTAGLLADVARGLHHAHQRRLIHRDVKPENILIDAETGTAHVADFGLAIRDDDLPRFGATSGTPAYMSPEQARREGHRLDGRSDVFSLGVVLYEMLAGRKPFLGASHDETLRRVATAEPTPPRDLDPTIPVELDRICRKALSKRASDRHATMRDLADDLASWQDRPAPEIPPAPVVPRGLRAFDSDDAGFFLDLLPGPRDRDGLPESVRFWKAKIEEVDPDRTFGVGLLCGPSGSGKSSLVRAGIVPRLSPRVVAVVVDAAPDDTPRRVLRALRSRIPGLPAEIGLAETFAALRLGGGPKVVVVLDQFEQWLHARGAKPEAELVDALRQCDGGRVQAILLVRDDFAMASARFMDALDVPIVQGRNFATLDLFDVDHARRVLGRLGRALGRLPEPPDAPTAEQDRFLDLAAAGLARDGRVVPVRLALFAEMVKARPWAPSTLEEAGGTEGIGVNFLEEAFVSRSANPAHRRLERPARDVLKALLPPAGPDIKGHMRSSEELRGASGLADRPGDFDALVRALDSDLRLITPVDPPESAVDPSARHWQLTHDYLVPALRTWLARKQKETRRGRAELRLEELAGAWSVRLEARHLPTPGEWLAIRTRTDPAGWTGPEREMMRRAGRRHGSRLALAGALGAALAFGGLAARDHFERERERAEVDGLVGRLLVADVDTLPTVAGSVAGLPSTWSRLSAVADDPRRSRGERLRASYALAGGPGEDASRLVDLALESDPHELAVVRDRIARFASNLAGGLWRSAGRPTLEPAARLRLAALLAVADPDPGRWRSLARPAVDAMLTAPPGELEPWAGLLQPVAGPLTPALRERSSDPSADPTSRVDAARVLARYADHETFAALLMEADVDRFVVLFPAAKAHCEAVVQASRDVLARRDPKGDGLDAIGRARRARNAALALLGLGRSGDDVRGLLSISEDPTARTMVILEARDFGIAPGRLVDALEGWKDPTARQALLLALERYTDRDWSTAPGPRARLAGLLPSLIADGPHQSERAAAEWLWRRRNFGGAIPVPAPSAGPRPDRDWWVTPEGHTMVVVGPLEGRGRPPLRFALGAREVSIRQFRRFQEAAPPFKDTPKFKDAPLIKDGPDDDRRPATMINVVDAMRYCRWLSDLEHIPEDQMCYPPVGEIRIEHLKLDDEARAKIGYRLPIEEEWQFAAAAGSTTPYFFGANEDHLGAFAWFQVNSDRRTQPVGELRPNSFGLFDVLGNASEWCQPGRSRPDPFVLRGGYFRYSPYELKTADYYSQSNTGYSYTGFRIARTIAPPRPADGPAPALPEE